MKHINRRFTTICAIALFAIGVSACVGVSETTKSTEPSIVEQPHSDPGDTGDASATTTTMQPQPPATTAPSSGLLSATDLRLVGSFTVPDEHDGTETSLAYSGDGLAYNAANHSLFLTGHDHHQRTAEIAIPANFGTGAVDDLPRASYIQAPADATGGNLPLIATPREEDYALIGGYLIVEGQLVISGYHFYDASDTQTRSHFLTDPSFSGSTTGEPFALADDIPARWLGGPMAVIPQTWRPAFGGNTFLTGLGGISIAGNSSVGPAAAVFSADTLAGDRPATLVLGYPLDAPLDAPEQRSDLWNLTSEMRGIVFPEGGDSVLFIGSHGIGDYCYGTGEGCGDPVRPHQGTHAAPYRYQVWAYDAQDLAQVFAGERTAETLDPHDYWGLELPIDAEHHEITGVAYDSDRGHIFIGQGHAEGNLPVIHVFELANN